MSEANQPPLESDDPQGTAAEFLDYCEEERERRRIAIEIHDQIGQALAVSKIQLGALQAEGHIPPVAGHQLRRRGNAEHVGHVGVAGRLGPAGSGHDLIGLFGRALRGGLREGDQRGLELVGERFEQLLHFFVSSSRVSKFPPPLDMIRSAL